MADENKRTVAGNVPSTATPLEPGDPVPMPSAIGATFAERKKAREASEKRIARAENKAVQDADGENKAVQDADGE